jgi:hypothetical protein
MEFRNVDTVRLGGGKIVAGFLNDPRQSEVRDEGGARFLRNVGSYKSHTA